MIPAKSLVFLIDDDASVRESPSRSGHAETPSYFGGRPGAFGAEGVHRAGDAA
jgi:hypothetical protein